MYFVIPQNRARRELLLDVRDLLRIDSTIPFNTGLQSDGIVYVEAYGLNEAMMRKA